jgi:hypothetical protein
MGELKYANYILTKLPGAPPRMKGGPKLNHILRLNDEIVKGAFHITCAWIAPGPNPGVYEAHAHPYDEAIGFIGTNPEDPGDLGAEAELWMEDEKYIINKSFLAFIPKGLKHCPLIVRDVKWPVFHFDIGASVGKAQFQWARDIVTPG